MAREIAEEAVRMIRADVELVKKDMQATLRRVIFVVIFLMLSAFAGLIAVVEALGAVPATFGPRLFGSNPWAPWLALGGVFLLLALLLALLGTLGTRGAFRSGRRVVNAIKEDVDWFRRVARRRDKSTS
jgi:hypothetical protein